MRLSLIALALLLAAPLQAAEIKLASWNIAWLTLRHAGDPALPRDLATRRPADLERLAAYARRLDADVVALQEVDGTDAAARVFDPAQYAFHFTEEHDVQRPGFAIRRGIPFTRNPDLEELDLIPRARFSLRRGADVTLHLGEQRLRLLSVHLKAGCREGPLDGSRDCESLGQQSAVLARWIAERREERAAFIVLGDFNRRMQGSRDAFLEELRAAAPLTRANEGVSDPCWSDARGGRPFITHMLLGGRAREWMVPGSLRVMVYAERDWSLRERISDHCPLSIRLRAG